MSSRASAARALGRILRGGAWSNVLLGGFDGDRGRVVAALVLDALRTHGLADTALGAASGRPLERIEDGVRDVLRIAVGELDRASDPPEVVTSAAVDAVRETGHERATGFVNGVLRSLVRSGLPSLPAAARLGVPEWLSERLIAAWGRDEADRFWIASSAPARVGLFGEPLPDVDLDGVGGIHGAWLADRPVPGLQVIDPASAAVAISMGAEPGERILDLAAAPGGKTAILSARVGSEGLVVAGDLHARRARTGASRVPSAHWVRADGTRPPFAPGTFDRVLVDAPCSGLGTLRRRPEIVRRVDEDDVERLVGVQGRLLEAAMGLARPGGRVVYSVCTVLPAETVERVAAPWRAPTEPSGGRTWGAGRLLGPHLGETDGMFISVFDT